MRAKLFYVLLTPSLFITRFYKTSLFGIMHKDIISWKSGYKRERLKKVSLNEADEGVLYDYVWWYSFFFHEIISNVFSAKVIIFMYEELVKQKK